MVAGGNGKSVFPFLQFGVSTMGVGLFRSHSWAFITTKDFITNKLMNK